MDTLESIIARLDLAPLPHEGGWFRRHFESPERDENGRARAAAIHYLMSPEGFSALHRLQTDEIWTFCDGAPIEILLLAPNGSAKIARLGREPAGDQRPAITVPGGCWQGARTLGAWSLADCAMAPAWDEREFELGVRTVLVHSYPAHSGMIRALTR